MKLRIQALLSGMFFLSVLSAASQAASGPVLREDEAVVVGGVTEHWKLVWKSEPSLICVPQGDDAQDWYTCPCMGYAFGEKGSMDLVRTVSGKADEVFPLTPLFKDAEWPAEGQVALQKWPEQDSDNQWYDTAPADAMDQVRKREPVKAMEFADYNHDGQATEFLLQVNVAPCGKQMSTLIGVTRKNSALHAFGTAEHPDKPLILNVQIWQELLDSKGAITSIEWSCGDHGAEEQEEVQVHTDAAGIHATELTYLCDKGPDKDKGTLKSKEVL